jgi:hypothetical protein
LWLGRRRNCAGCNTNGDRCADIHRDVRANGDRDTDPDVLAFGKSVTERDGLTKPDRRSLRLRALRNRMGLLHHVREPRYRSGWKPDCYVHGRIRADGSGSARHHFS